jgi:hypothetical protein
MSPAVSERRLLLTPNGNIRYQLKTPYRDGATPVILEPLDVIACIEDPVVIMKNFDHLKEKGECQEVVRLP